MVKNTTGGTGTKGLARKHQNKGQSALRVSTDPLEKYALVTKAFGNGMVEIMTHDPAYPRLVGHIRGQMRGKQKRNNLISVNSIVLVGLRGWENPVKNCDILSVYDDNEVTQLRQIPSIDLKIIVNAREQTTSFGKGDTDDNEILFVEADDNEIEDSRPLIPPQRAPKADLPKAYDSDDEDVGLIDIDDI
jgi:translation initiation factor IF-1